MKIILRYHWLLALLLYIGAALYITHPLIFNLGTFITGYGDELLIAWIQNWVLYSLITNPLELFNANIYFPYSNTLAYSETFITSSLFASIVKLFTDEPIATVNFTYITSLFTLGYSIFLLSYYISKDFIASLFVGFMVIFSPAVLSYSTHLQVLGIAGVPLAILFFIKYLDTNQLRYFILACLMFLMQMYNSFLPGYFILSSWLIVILVYWLKNRKQVKKVFSYKSVGIFIIACLLIIPILIPYFNVSNEFKYTRDIRENIHNAFQIEDFLYPGDTTRLKDLLLSSVPTNKYSQNNEFKSGYLGFIFTLLMLFAIAYLLGKRKELSQDLLIFCSIACMSFVISLGPLLHFNRHTLHDPFPIPLPYALLYYILPGFQGFRTPVRWEMLLIIVLAVIIALVLHKVLKKVSLKQKTIIYSVLFILVFAEFTHSANDKKVIQVSEFPKVYSWLQNTPKDTVIIEMPIYTWDIQPYVMDENMREYYSTQHFRKMVNGASGFSPQPWQLNVKEMLASFPDDLIIQDLDEKGVDYIIIHKEEYDELAKDKFKVNGASISGGDKIISRLNKSEHVQLVKKYDNDYVYRIIK